MFYGQKGRSEIYEIASLCFKEKKMRGEEKALTSLLNSVFVDASEFLPFFFLFCFPRAISCFLHF